MVHYPGRVDAMALKDFKGMSGITDTPYPHGIGPLVDTVVRRRLQFHCCLKSNQLAEIALPDLDRRWGLYLVFASRVVLKLVSLGPLSGGLPGPGS